MSQIRELIMVFRGVDEVTPTMNSVTGSLTNVARISQQASTQMAGMGGMLSREWEKFRRTFGYAFAGTATYAIFQSYQNLKQYNSELGTLNAMVPTLGQSVNQIGQIALQISTATGAPLNDVQQSINNIVQSIPDISNAARMHLIPAMANIEAMSSRIMDVDPRSFGSTVLGIARAYTPIGTLSNPKTGPAVLERIASQLYTTRTTTPRLTGQDITSYIPMLIGGARAGRFSLEQALSLFSVAQQTIQRPATTSQYLRQLMLRIRRPTSQERPFFQQAGLGPSQLANMSGMQILEQLIQHGLSLPGGINRQALQQAVRTGDYNRIAATGQSAQFFQSAVGGRMQSLVAMTALASNFGQVQLQMRRLQSNSNDINNAFERWKTDNSLQLMSNALSNATTDVLQNFMPALSQGATGLTALAGMSQRISNGMRAMDRNVNNFVLGKVVNPGFARRHDILGGVLDTTLTVGGIMALMRSPAILKGMGIGKLLEGRGGRLMAPFAAAETASAATAALAGQANGTPSMPFWVVIHPLSMSTVPNLFNNKSNQEKDKEKQAAQGIFRKLVSTLGAEGLAARLGVSGADLALGGTGIGLPVAALLIASQLGSKNPNNNPVLRRTIGNTRALPNTIFRSGNLNTPILQAVQQANQVGQRRVEGRSSTGVIGHGVVEATINLEPTQELKGLLKPQQAKAHVPTTLWDLSSSPPTERGKAKVTRNR